MKDIIKKLRDKQPVTLFRNVTGYKQKVFIRFQLNRKEKFICWQRFYSLDRRSWTEQNSYLSLKDVVSIIMNK